MGKARVVYLGRSLLSALREYRSGAIVERSKLFRDNIRRGELLEDYGLLEACKPIQMHHVAYRLTPIGLAVVDKATLLSVETFRIIV